MSEWLVWILIQNAILFWFLGIETMVHFSHSWKTTLRMGSLTVLLLLLNNLCCYQLHHILEEYNFLFLQLPVFFLVIVILNAVLYSVTKLFFSHWVLETRSFWHKLPLNTLFLGSAFLGVKLFSSLAELVFWSIGMGVGWGVILLLMTAARQKLFALSTLSKPQILGLVFILLGIFSLLVQSFHGPLTAPFIR